ncbi:hypothetical protein TNCV_2244801 [Trichonephila clavipes]|nr:hypothetical protein TNCV_2244801 [Trichonephila clavipes]
MFFQQHFKTSPSQNSIVFPSPSSSLAQRKRKAGDCRTSASAENLSIVIPNDEAHFWLSGYVNKQNCRIWSEANPQVYVETLLHPEKLTVWCALWAGGILLQKR